MLNHCIQDTVSILRCYDYIYVFADHILVIRYLSLFICDICSHPMSLCDHLLSISTEMVYVIAELVIL